jgi:hypothetical protein
VVGGPNGDSLAASAVSIDRAWREIGSGGQVLLCREVTATLASQGIVTANSQIPASVFGLTTIKSCSPMTKSDNSLIVVAAPNYLGTLLLCKGAGDNAPAAATGTFKFTVKGN